MKPIAEFSFDLSYTDEKMDVRIFAPKRDGKSWSCLVEMDEPFNLKQKAYGASSLQALYLALKLVSINLYGSRTYRDGELGAYGEFGGDLHIPAMHGFLDIAPYPF